MNNATQPAAIGEIRFVNGAKVETMEIAFPSGKTTREHCPSCERVRKHQILTDGTRQCGCGEIWDLNYCVEMNIAGTWTLEWSGDGCASRSEATRAAERLIADSGCDPDLVRVVPVSR